MNDIIIESNENKKQTNIHSLLTELGTENTDKDISLKTNILKSKVKGMLNHIKFDYDSLSFLWSNDIKIKSRTEFLCVLSYLNIQIKELQRFMVLIKRNGNSFFDSFIVKNE